MPSKGLNGNEISGILLINLVTIEIQEILLIKNMNPHSKFRSVSCPKGQGNVPKEIQVISLHQIRFNSINHEN